MLPGMDSPFIYVANKLGASSDELKLIFSFLLSYPLAAVLKRIPDSKPWQKNIFIVGVSLFYLVGLFDLWDGLWTLFVSSAGSYAIAYFIDGSFMPWVGFAFMMGHMAVNHIYRQLAANPSGVDITGAQMVLVMKLTAFCWNVHDGRLPANELSDFQKERAIRQLPDLLDYAGYVLFFPSLFAGPAFDYVDYRQYISTSMFKLPPGVDPSKAPPTRKKRKIPRSGRPASWKAAQGLFWIVLFLQFSGRYNPEKLLSDRFLEYGFVRRVGFLWALGFTTRTKYYGVWALTEGACILSGIGYAGIDAKTGRAKWDRLVNVIPQEIELAQNTRAFLGSWNINTNSWLRNYMYLRVTPKGKKPGFRATLATFVTSAFWHGFYPGYYLAFVLASFLQTIAKHGRRLFRPFFLTPDSTAPTQYKIYYDVFTWVVTQAAFAFTVQPFILLTLAATVKCWARVYFYGIVGVIACFAFLNSPAKLAVVKRLKMRNQPGGIQRAASAEVLPGGTLGLPDDPEKEVEDMVVEVRAEIERMKREGRGSIDVPDVRAMVQERLRRRGKLV
ncbi:putative MBOAT family protein [Trichodelitschia bisporula]|uniref:Putative MBOAT family protein n=1 Tax=Trichodelitschia bisporula TaxID=703511 RepID=A0A6G1I8Q6_9PEZI|nr:putative MBOAT family protein [Trichodelitschia bisporula]